MKAINKNIPNPDADQPKKKQPKKPKTAVPETSTDVYPIGDLTILKEAIKKQLAIENKIARPIDTNQDVKELVARNSEYLDCFLIIGYDLDGNRIIIKKADSAQQNDSLNESLRYTLYRTLGGDED